MFYHVKYKEHKNVWLKSNKNKEKEENAATLFLGNENSQYMVEYTHGNTSRECSSSAHVGEWLRNTVSSSIRTESDSVSGLWYLHLEEIGTPEAWNGEINLHLNYLTCYYEMQ